MNIIFIDFFIFCFILFLLSFKIKEYFVNDFTYVKSKVDNRKYLVKNLKDSQEAADILARINTKILILIDYMLTKYPDNLDIQFLHKNYNPKNISEGYPEEGYTSYTVNKGEKIIVCIRQKNNNFVDENIILYPVIHELAHCAIKEIGHTNKFWDTFKWFLKEAVAIGIYEKIDYNAYNVPYCGITLTSSVI